MRILWIGKQPNDGASGDEIFDHKTIAACRARGHAIDLYHPRRVGRLAEMRGLIAGAPHYRARFDIAGSQAEIGARAAGYDAVVCSWEPFDALARTLSPPCVLILHNVTSRALPALFPGNPLAALASARAGTWERRSYRSRHFAAIAALSRRDLAYLHTLPDPPRLLLLPPGMPPLTTLAADATLCPELVVSGTFDWVPKRRDICRFAREYSALSDRLPVRAGLLPPEATQLLRPRQLPSVEDCAAHLRLGVITDRFEAGHKLKTMAYIAANQIVLSLAPVEFDFADIPDFRLFIRTLRHPAEIGDHVASLTAMPPRVLRQRFRAFQQNCAQRFSWDAVAENLLQAAGSCLEAAA